MKIFLPGATGRTGKLVIEEITYNINSFKPSKAQNNNAIENENALIKL
jgi:hypothetical protein